MAQVSGCTDPLLYCFLSAECREDLTKIMQCRLSEAVVFASEIEVTTHDRKLEIFKNARRVAGNIGLLFHLIKIFIKVFSYE